MTAAPSATKQQRQSDAERRAAAAERQRRFRARQKSVEIVVAVRIDVDVTEALIAAGRLARNRDGDREEIARAIELLLAGPILPVTRYDGPILHGVDSPSTTPERGHADPKDFRQSNRHPGALRGAGNCR